MTETTPCPVCQTPCIQDTSDEGTQSLRPAGLTMQELREWLEADYYRVYSEEVASEIRRIIAIIDEGRLP